MTQKKMQRKVFLKGPPTATTEQMLASNPESERAIGLSILAAAGFGEADVTDALVQAAIAVAIATEREPPPLHLSDSQAAQALRSLIEAELAKTKH